MRKKKQCSRCRELILLKAYPFTDEEETKRASVCIECKEEEIKYTPEVSKYPPTPRQRQSEVFGIFY